MQFLSLIFLLAPSMIHADPNEDSEARTSTEAEALTFHWYRPCTHRSRPARMNSANALLTDWHLMVAHESDSEEPTQLRAVYVNPHAQWSTPTGDIANDLFNTNQEWLDELYERDPVYVDTHAPLRRATVPLNEQEFHLITELRIAMNDDALHPKLEQAERSAQPSSFQAITATEAFKQAQAEFGDTGYVQNAEIAYVLGQGIDTPWGFTNTFEHGKTNDVRMNSAFQFTVGQVKPVDYHVRANMRPYHPKITEFRPARVNTALLIPNERAFSLSFAGTLSAEIVSRMFTLIKSIREIYGVKIGGVLGANAEANYKMRKQLIEQHYYMWYKTETASDYGGQWEHVPIEKQIQPPDWADYFEGKMKKHGKIPIYEHGQTFIEKGHKPYIGVYEQRAVCDRSMKARLRTSAGEFHLMISAGHQVPGEEDPPSVLRWMWRTLGDVDARKTFIRRLLELEGFLNPYTGRLFRQKSSVSQTQQYDVEHKVLNMAQVYDNLKLDVLSEILEDEEETERLANQLIAHSDEIQADPINADWPDSRCIELHFNYDHEEAVFLGEKLKDLTLENMADKAVSQLHHRLQGFGIPSGEMREMDHGELCKAWYDKLPKEEAYAQPEASEVFNIRRAPTLGLQTVIGRRERLKVASAVLGKDMFRMIQLKMEYWDPNGNDILIWCIDPQLPKTGKRPTYTILLKVHPGALQYLDGLPEIIFDPYEDIPEPAEGEALFISLPAPAGKLDKQDKISTITARELIQLEYQGYKFVQDEGSPQDIYAQPPGYHTKTPLGMVRVYMSTRKEAEDYHAKNGLYDYFGAEDP